MTSTDVINLSPGELRSKIALAFTRLFPLVLLATSKSPAEAIGAYLEDLEEGEEQPDQADTYTLARLMAETALDETRIQTLVTALERKKQAIFYGPPGTGKTYVAERLAKYIAAGGDGFVETVQFHPSYSYDDFVQGIRPETNKDGALEYPMTDGTFIKFCDKAQRRRSKCVLMIDEINRANLSKVFGELMYLLEYRDRDVLLAGGRRFGIPENVRIIGTMNTADRSIALVDHALRRRFAFFELGPDYDLLRHFHTGDHFPIEKLIDTLKAINTEIGDPHYSLGVSFFLLTPLAQHIESVWRTEIEPYLEEYFFDRPERVEAFRWETVAAGLAE